jgi:hypothetical protein
MTHWPYIAASYAIGVLLPAAMGITAWTRSAAARRKLRAVDPRLLAREAARRAGRAA